MKPKIPPDSFFLRRVIEYLDHIGIQQMCHYRLGDGDREQLETAIITELPHGAPCYDPLAGKWSLRVASDREEPSHMVQLLIRSDGIFMLSSANLDAIFMAFQLRSAEEIGEIMEFVLSDLTTATHQTGTLELSLLIRFVDKTPIDIPRRCVRLINFRGKVPSLRTRCAKNPHFVKKPDKQGTFLGQTFGRRFSSPSKR